MIPAGFSTSPCLSRWTMVTSDIARPAYLVQVRQGSRSGTGEPQRPPDLPGHVVAVVPHHECREAQHAIAVQGEIVVTVHVRPVLGRVQVMDPVHLDDQPGRLPAGIQPPAPPGGVLAPR